jgi:S-ribosylhomocysteine lyase
MKKIASFTVNHLKLLPGIYISRKDCLQKDVLTTFDLRFTKPNDEPVMDTAAIHALEHLGATFLRNDNEWGNKIIYFGPMGCRTGFYLILMGDLEPKQIVDLVHRMLLFIIEFEGKIPGSSARDCGNYLDLNLTMAKYYAKRYLNDVILNITEERTVYQD